MKMIMTVAICGTVLLLTSSVRLATAAEHFHARKLHQVHAPSKRLWCANASIAISPWVPLRRPPTIAVDGPRRPATNVVRVLRVPINNGSPMERSEGRSLLVGPRESW